MTALSADPLTSSSPRAARRADPAELLSPARLAQFDAVIDVRSPSEFAEDHVPGALNLPVLDDDQRALVGAMYVQVSKFEAKKVGAALVAENIARHLRTALRDMPGSFSPLVYCWRGGQRSGAMATVLSQIGWRVETLTGGYKTYRRRVMARLYDQEPWFRVIALDGDTGSAKTEILGRLAARGLQVVDLEALAGHRGSVFGAVSDQAQPGQKRFESALLNRLEGFDPSRPILVEAESNKIGARVTPPALWKAMCAAPQIAVTAPAPARAAYLLARYPNWTEDPERLDRTLASLSAQHGRERVAAWQALARDGAHGALVEDLVAQHYDPAYARSRRRRGRPSLGEVALADLSEAAQEAAADEIAALAAGPGSARSPGA